VLVASAPSERVLVLAECFAGGEHRTAGEWLDPMETGGVPWLMTETQVNALWASEGRILSPIPTQYAPAKAGGVRVLQLTHYDPGCAAYRYHSAVNSVDGVTSAFVRWGHSNPACDLRQWDGTDAYAIRALWLTAEVVHCHMDYTCLTEELREGRQARHMMVRHYHGSMDTRRPVLFEPEADARWGATIVGARPYHARRGGAAWLPIPMPVKDYEALAKGHKRGKAYRVAHSPSIAAIKGTDVFLAVVAELQAEGVPIEAVLIQGVEHGEALRIKATCDATFDSFWLGMQGSGLEGAAMGQAVVAGDAEAVADYAHVGLECPYTFAPDADALRDTLRRLATDTAYHAAEAKRVGAYVKAHHDYPVVGAKYLDILTEARRGTPNAY